MGEYVTTKLLTTVKAKLDKLKGDKGLSEYIEMMLAFFEVTGAKPSDFQTHPTLVLKKDVERIITIIKAQEKDILKPLFQAMQSIIENGLKTSVTAEAGTRGGEQDNDPPVTNEMIIQVADENTRLNELLDKERQTGEKLRKEIEQLKQTANSGGENRNAEAAELFTWLKSQMKKNSFTPDYVISGNTYNVFAERLEKLLK